LPTSSLIATRIAERRLYTCAAPAYLDRAGTPETLEALDRHDLLVGTSPLWHFSGNTPENTAHEVIYKPAGRWRCNSGQVVLAAALDGMGLCQLPDFYVLDALRTGRLVSVLEDHAAPVEPIWAVYPSRRHLSPKVTQFVRLLKTKLPGPGRIGPAGPARTTPSAMPGSPKRGFTTIAHASGVERTVPREGIVRR
jgi:DNA-binding transcriptional LysR family regulator